MLVPYLQDKALVLKSQQLAYFGRHLFDGLPVPGVHPQQLHRLVHTCTKGKLLVRLSPLCNPSPTTLSTPTAAGANMQEKKVLNAK